MKQTTHLDDLIEMSGFSYAEFRRDEKAIIEPQLEKLGYTNFQYFWFEPLIRGIQCIDPQGFNVELWYG
jgi:hypothetical protein